MNESAIPVMTIESLGDRDSGQRPVLRETGRTYHLHGTCEECQMFGAIAEFVVWIPTDATYTVNPEVNVCDDCVDDAKRRLEDGSTEFAQVESLYYGGAA